jgi:hypothetical protein
VNELTVVSMLIVVNENEDGNEQKVIEKRNEEELEEAPFVVLGVLVLMFSPFSFSL